MALKVKTYNNVQANVTFSKASSRVEINPTAGEAATENIALTLGKISKWYDSLVPTGGSSGKFLGWNSSGTAKWVDAPTAEDKNMSQTLKTDNVNRPLLMSIESTSNTTATVTTTGARNNSMYGNVSTGLIFCRGREISNVTLKTGTTAQSHITLNTLMTWLITSKQYIPSGKYCHVVLSTAWDYANSDILQVSINSTNYEIQLAGVIIEFMGSATSYNAGTFRLLIHSSPTTSFTAATGYTKFPTATIAEYTCNGSSYSPVWKMMLSAHPTITVSADSTSTASPAHGGTFTTVDSVTRDANGHVTKINTKTVTLPSDQNTDTKVTQTNTTTSADYRILFSENANDTTETVGARKNTGLKYNPNSGMLYAPRITLKSATVPAINIDLDTLKPTAGQNVNILGVSFKNADGSATHTTYPIGIIGNDATGAEATYNSGVRLGSTSGITIVAAGESSTSFASAQTKYNEEQLYLVSDGGIFMYTNMSNEGALGYGPWRVSGFTTNPSSGQVVITDGTAGGIKSSGYTIATSVPSGAVFTDTKVTSSANHYTPATASGSDKTASASGATAAWGIDVVKGITINTDGKGHITGLSVTSGKIPGNPDTDTKVTQTAVGSTYTNYRPLVISASNADSTPPTATTVTDGTFITSSIYCQPSSGSVYATKFVGPLDVSRVTKDSKVFPGANKAIIEEYAAGSTYNLPSNHYYHIISIQGPDTKFGTQLALGMTTTGAYYRNYNNQTWSDWKNIINTNTTYGISGAYGDSNNNTWKTTLTAGGSGTSSTVPTSSTSAYGITKLYNGVDSTSTGLAATANAVKTAYDKANHSHPYLPLAGGTMTGVINLWANQYDVGETTKTALNCNNSNITGINSLIFNDASENAGEGILFYRSATPTWDVIWANGGLLHFTPNYPTSSDDLSIGFTLTSSTTDAWSSIGVGLYSTERYQLKVIRTNGTNTYPSWMGWNYSAAIAFGGADTKGVISMHFSEPGVMFIGGQNDSSHTKPNWNFGISGTSGTTYNLANMLTTSTKYALSDAVGGPALSMKASKPSAVPIATLDTATIKAFYNVNYNYTGNMPGNNNAIAIIQLNRHQGDYDSQIGFSNNGNIYYRCANGSALTNTTPWVKVAFSSDSVPMETVSTDVSANTYFTKTCWVNWNKNAGTSTTNLPTANWGILLTKALPSVQVWIPDNASGIYFRRKADANTDPTAWWGLTGTAGNTYDLANISNTGFGYRTLTSSTINTTAGSFVFGGDALLGSVNDWAGIQVEGRNDRFQLLINGHLMVRQNDDATISAAGWTAWTSCLRPADVSGSGGITVTQNDVTIGSGSTAATYKGTITLSHTNSITAGTAKGDNSKTLTFGGTFKIPSITYDANGHITTWTTTTMTMPSNPNTNTTYTLGTSTDRTVTPNEDTVTLTPSSGSVQTIKVPYAKRAKYVYTDSIGSGAASHAAALQTYFNANKDSINRNSVLGYYSNAESNGSICMGYFLNGYNDTPYGGFFVAHYNTPKYVGISNGTFTQHILLSSQNYTDYTVKKDGTGASGSWDINASTATRSSYIDIVASNEVRFSVATKPANATDIHIGHAWSDGTTDAKINSYVFKNGGAGLALIKSKGYYLVDSGGNTYTGLYDNGSNLWIGSTQTQAKHHIGQTYISAGYDSTNSAGNSTIYISVPNAANNNGTNYAVLHAGNYTSYALASTTKYAASASVGGPASSVATTEANANADRVVFFADNTDTKKLVYDNDFKYNPSTDMLVVKNVKGGLYSWNPASTQTSPGSYSSYTTAYFQTAIAYAGEDGRMGNSNDNWWAHYLTFTHNANYRYILRFPFWGAPQYQRPTATSSNERWRNILTDETGAGGDYFLAYPADGYYYSHGGATGAIDITLPVGPGMMLSFSVDIWDYAANKSCTYKIAGYAYATDNKWYSTTAYCIGKPTHSMAIPVASSGGQTEITNLNVRFGYNSTSGKLKVQIGETDTSWSYLAVQIHDVTFCYGTTYFSTVSKGWSIGLVTSNIPNVSSTVKATNIAYHASAIALTHGNECNFTGPSSGTTNIWFGYRKADVDGTETNTAYISRYLFGNGNNTAVAGITCGDIIINTATTGTPTLSFIRGTTADNYYDWRLRDSGGDFYFDVCTGSNTWTSRAWFPYGSNNFTILGSMSLKNGSYTATVQPSTMTANRTLVLPDKSGGLPVSNILYEDSTGTQAPVVAEAKGYKYFIVTVYHGTLGEQTAMITPNQSFTDHCYFSWTRIDDSQTESLRVAGAHIKVEPASSTNSITFTVYISKRHILAPGNSSTISSTATSGTPVIRKIIGFM